ncbi:MAG: peptidase modulator of gyrase [Bryobacterales bacterium]|nr:peptidase modulator of gyrase [Bryobacterales bacterium]
MRLKYAAVWLGAVSLALPTALFIAPQALAAPEAPGASLLQILRGELDREFTSLKVKGDPPPYYMAYEVTDEETESASASMGALVRSTRNRSRGVDTTVRVGSPQFDNYHPYKGTPVHFTNFSTLSLDDNPDQIRRALWEETNRVYKAVSLRYLQIKTDEQLLAQQNNKDADFSAEPAGSFSSEPETYRVDTGAWSARVRNWSAAFKSHPDILASQVNFLAQRETRTFVNTEGTAVKHGSNLFRVEISAEALAPDGMDVRDFATIEASDPAHVPQEKAVQARVEGVAAKVDQLVQAPPAEPIVCPAILSGRAAAVFFHEIFGHRVEGHRQKDVEEGQTFTKMLGQQVLPDFLSVQFDATRRQFDGNDLIGHYEYDDEGVKARPINVVENGVLKTFLLSRSPVGEFTTSNGHGRRQPGFEVVSRQSNLLVQSSRQVSNAELRAKLIQEVRRQTKPYGLYFEEVASGYTSTGRRGLQAFTVVPLVVYRVFADGHPDELIRGVDIVGTPLASFQKIVATSDHPEIFNGYCGAESGSVPVSAVSPAILVSEIETQKKRNSQQKPPLLPRPGEKAYRAVFE